jgi:putative hydrolase of HD superfamily
MTPRRRLHTYAAAAPRRPVTIARTAGHNAEIVGHDAPDHTVTMDRNDRSRSPEYLAEQRNHMPDAAIDGFLNSALPSRMRDQLSFLVELEKLKLVQRRNRTIDGSGYENSAEHSWHVAIMAMVLQEHSDKTVDMLKVLKMLLLHDVVEIDAGDTWLYAESTDQQSREREAAQRLFGLLPETQRDQVLALWQEFEAGETAEASFAKGIDAFQPLLNHLAVGGPDSGEPKPKLSDVLGMKQVIGGSSSGLWEAARLVAEASAERGLYER